MMIESKYKRNFIIHCLKPQWSHQENVGRRQNSMQALFHVVVRFSDLIPLFLQTLVPSLRVLSGPIC